MTISSLRSPAASQIRQTKLASLPVPVRGCVSSSAARCSINSSSSSGSSCCHVLPAPTPSTSRHLASIQEAPKQRQHVVAQAGFGFSAKSKAGASKANSKDCPCGSGKLYSKCCEVFHKSAVAHPDPERLIKARYSAFVKRLPKFLRATSHPDNPALKGSSVTLEDGTEKQCTYEEDLAMTSLAAEFNGFEILGSQMSEDGSSCSVDCKARYKRVIDRAGKRVGKPEEQTWTERATLVKDDEGNWLVKEVQATEPAAKA